MVQFGRSVPRPGCSHPPSLIGVSGTTRVEWGPGGPGFFRVRTRSWPGFRPFGLSLVPPVDGSLESRVGSAPSPPACLFCTTDRWTFPGACTGDPHLTGGDRCSPRDRGNFRPLYLHPSLLPRTGRCKPTGPGLGSQQSEVWRLTKNGI